MDNRLAWTWAGSTGKCGVLPRVRPPIVVIGDHLLFSAALAFALGGHGFDTKQLSVLRGTSTVFKQLHPMPPGLVLLDLHLGYDEQGRWLDSVGMIKPLHALGWAVVVVNGDGDRDRMAGAIAAGALGEIPRSATVRVMLDIVIAAVEGRPVMSEQARNEWLARDHGRQPERREFDQRLARLSPREQEVLDLLDQGQCAQVIAEHLVISLTTVRAQIRAILAKLDVSSQLEAVALLHGRSPSRRTALTR